jgi:hypothetical protein
MASTHPLILALSLTTGLACSSGSEPRQPSAEPSPAIQAASGELVFTPQPGWIVETPTSAMRKAQYRLPHAEKDAEDASLVVTFFAGQGGSPQANIDRWAGQFEQPDGRASSEVMKNTTRTVSGMSVHDVEISGTYVAETAPGSGQHLRKEGWRMLASMVEAKEGPYFAKLVGPEATVARWQASYSKFVGDVKPGK